MTNGLPGTRDSAVAAALRTASYEVLPLRGAEDAVLAHVPRDVALTVTTTEAKGLAPTLDRAVRLAGHGYRVAPHLAARPLRDRAELACVVDRLREGGITGIVALGGDAAEPAGDYPDALALLRDLDELGHPFTSVGVAGYPEGHGRIPDELVERALRDKAAHATGVVTQLCFDPATTLRWARRIHAGGITLPVRVGVPGVVSRQKLIRISAGLGLGQSARFLATQQSMLLRFLLPGGYRPDRIVGRIGPETGAPGASLAGFHVFTFNDLASTEAWRRRWLDRLAGERP